MDKSNEIINNKTTKESVAAGGAIDAFRRSSIVGRSPEGVQPLGSNLAASIAAEAKKTPQGQREMYSTPVAQSSASERGSSMAKVGARTNPVVDTPTTRHPGGLDGVMGQKPDIHAVERAGKSSAGEDANVIMNEKAQASNPLRIKMMALGEAIDSLLEYYKGRHNVHHEIKKIGSMIKRRHTEAIMVMEKSEKELATPITKTPTRHNPNAAKGETYSRVTKSAKRARSKISPSIATAGDKTLVPNAKSPAAKKRCDSPVVKGRKEGVAATDKEAGFTLVKGKRDRKPKTIRARPDAIIISKAENVSYADILRRVKTTDSLRSLGDDVKAIRRTAKQELIIELKGVPDEKTSVYQAAIEDVLKTAAKVTVKTHTVTLQCRDLDEVTTSEEICDALHAQCKIRRPEESAIKSLRAAYNGTQTAFIALPAGDAKKVLEVQRVRIGWVSCRIREATSPKRCFRCWGYGHLAQNCKDEIDRTGLCRKCGQEGHKAASCSNPERCALCKGEHSAGSYKCPLAKKARREKRT